MKLYGKRERFTDAITFTVTTWAYVIGSSFWCRTIEQANGHKKAKARRRLAQWRASSAQVVTLTNHRRQSSSSSSPSRTFCSLKNATAQAVRNSRRSSVLGRKVTGTATVVSLSLPAGPTVGPFQGRTDGYRRNMGMCVNYEDDERDGDRCPIQGRILGLLPLEQYLLPFTLRGLHSCSFFILLCCGSPSFSMHGTSMSLHTISLNTTL